MTLGSTLRTATLRGGFPVVVPILSLLAFVWVPIGQWMLQQA